MKYCIDLIKAHLKCVRVIQKVSKKNKPYVMAEFVGFGIKLPLFVPESLIPDIMENKDYHLDLELCIDGFHTSLKLVHAVEAVNE